MLWEGTEQEPVEKQILKKSHFTEAIRHHRESLEISPKRKRGHMNNTWQKDEIKKGEQLIELTGGSSGREKQMEEEKDQWSKEQRVSQISHSYVRSSNVLSICADLFHYI